MSPFENPPKSPFFKGGLSKAFLKLMTLHFNWQSCGRTTFPGRWSVFPPAGGHPYGFSVQRLLKRLISEYCIQLGFDDQRFRFFQLAGNHLRVKLFYRGPLIPFPTRSEPNGARYLFPNVSNASALERVYWDGFGLMNTEEVTSTEERCLKSKRLNSQKL